LTDKSSIADRQSVWLRWTSASGLAMTPSFDQSHLTK